MDKNRYLITGASDTLGHLIAERLSAAGAPVRALVREGDRSAERLPDSAELITGDITDTASLDRFFADAGNGDAVVIHCEELPAASSGYSMRVYDVNVSGTRNVVERCVESGAKKLVCVSSASAIPELAAGEPILEPRLIDPDLVASFYGKTKAEAARIALDAASREGLDASIVFPSTVYGPGYTAYHSLSTFISEYAKGAMRWGIDGTLNIVDVRDLAEGIIACSFLGRKGERYIMANRAVSMREIMRLLDALIDAKGPRIFIPGAAACALARLAEFACVISGATPKLTPLTVRNFVKNNNYCSDKAAAELGFSVRPIERTMADSVAWLKQEGRM